MAFGKNTSDEDTDLERDAEGDGVDTKSEAEIEGLEATDKDDTDEQRDADDTGDGESGKLPVGVKKRFAKLSAQRRKVEQERDALAARVAAYETREREKEDKRKAAEQATPEGMKAAERRQAIRAAIDETYGDGTSDLLEDQRSERQLQKEQYALNAVGYLKSELEDHGIAVTNETLVRWERAVGSEMQEDPQLLAMFKRPATAQDAIVEAFNRVRDGLANPAIKQQGGKPLERIERNRSAVLGSGRSSAGADEGSPYPDNYTAKPPKNASPAQLEEFWQNHRDQMWKKLNSGADA